MTPCRASVSRASECAYKEECDMKTGTIRQIMPIGREYSPMILVHQDDGTNAYEDAICDGWSVMYALVDEEYGGHVAFYVMDQLGGGEIDETGVRLVPTVHCNRCGRRMYAFARTDLGHVEYSCSCGMRYTKENGWISSGEDEEEIL